MKTYIKSAATVLLTLIAAAASATGEESYPSRPIQLVIPYAPGGGTDLLGRIVADHLSARLGQRVVPENRPGAGTALASGFVSRSTPNGHTLLFSTAAHSLNATMNADLQFDPVNDFAFVGKVGQIGLLVMTNPRQVMAKDLGELVDLMRKSPGKVQYGSAGIGTPMHMGGELLKYLTRADAEHVPYKGESAALNDLLGGQLTFMLCSITTCAPRAQDGSLRALAITSNTRAVLAPEIPTVGEAGFPGAEVNTWFFVAAPKGTSSAVVEKLNGAMNGMLSDDKFRSRVEAMGIEPESRTTPAATKEMVQSEIERWRPIAKRAAEIKN